jgi:hypothetical protein
MLHCQNCEMKTLFSNVVNCFGWKEGKFAPARETPLALPLALSFDFNLFGFATYLGRLPKFLLPDLSLLPQFLG